jgi:hypothetical protein
VTSIVTTVVRTEAISSGCGVRTSSRVLDHDLLDPHRLGEEEPELRVRAAQAVVVPVVVGVVVDEGGGGEPGEFAGGLHPGGLQRDDGDVRERGAGGEGGLGAVAGDRGAGGIGARGGGAVVTQEVDDQGEHRHDEDDGGEDTEGTSAGRRAQRRLGGDGESRLGDARPTGLAVPVLRRVAGPARGAGDGVAGRRLGARLGFPSRRGLLVQVERFEQVVERVDLVLVAHVLSPRASSRAGCEVPPLPAGPAGSALYCATIVLYATVRTAEPWDVASIAGAIAILVVVIGLLTWAIRVTLRR